MKKSILTLITVLLAGLSTAWGQNVAKIGDTEYATLQEAISAATDGQTVTIIANHEVTSLSNIEKSITIDLNGNTLSWKATDVHATGNVTVTFKNGTIDVTGANSTGDCIIGCGWYNDKVNTLNFDHVTLKGNGYKSAYAVVYAYGDAVNTINVTGCTINLKNDNSSAGGVFKGGSAVNNIINVTNSTLNMGSAQRGFTTCTVNITGSEVSMDKMDNGINACAVTIDNSDVAITNGSGRGITAVANTPVVIKGNSTVSLVGNSEGDLRLDSGSSVKVEDTATLSVAEVKENGGTVDVAGTATYNNTPAGATVGTASYASLEAAVAAANDGQTITLLKDITLDERLFVNAGDDPAYDSANKRYATTSDNKSITLDLNGKNITSSSNIALAGGSLNITGTGTISTTEGGLAPIEVRGTGDLTSKRTLTIGENVTLSGSTYGLNVFGSNDDQKNTIDVNVNGTVNGMLFVLGNLKNTENAINIVVNGTVDASNATAGDAVKTGIALNGNANVTINNVATVKGESGVEVRAGNLTVNGGTITGTATEYKYDENTSGTTTKGAAIAVAQHGTKLPIAVTLNGGTLVGKELIGVTDVNDDMSSVTVTATEGFVLGTATSLPEGYGWVSNGGTPETFTLGPVVASITEGTTTRYYATLNEAFTAATTGQTVKLLCDYDATSESGYENANRLIGIDKSITFDGGGHTLTVKNYGVGMGTHATGDINVTVKDMTIINNSSNGRCIDTRAHIGTLTLDGVTMKSTGVAQPYNQPLTIAGSATDYSTGNPKVVINNSTIQTSEDATQYYAIILWVPTDLTITNSTLKGWANVYVKPDAAGSKVAISGSTLLCQGLSGSSNGFSLIVNEAQNCEFTLTSNNYTVNAATAFNTPQGLIDLQKSGNTVKFLGNNTFTTNNADWTPIVYNYGKLVGSENDNHVYFDAASKEVFKTYVNSEDGTRAISEATVPIDDDNLYPLNYTPEIAYYWDKAGGGYQGSYYYFNEPFENGWLDAGEYIDLMKDVTLTKNLTWAKTDASFRLRLMDYTLTKGEYSIALKAGAVVNTDKEVDVFTPFEDGLIIVKRTTADGFSYKCESSASPSTDVVAQIGDQGYTTLKDAFNAVQDGQTIKLLTNVSLNNTTGSPDGNNFTCPLESGTITLDYNGKTLSAANRFVFLKSGVTLVTNMVYFNGDERPLMFKAVAGAAAVTALRDSKYTIIATSLTDVAYVNEEGEPANAQAVALTEAYGPQIFFDDYFYYTAASSVAYNLIRYNANANTKLILVDGTTLSSTLISANNGNKGQLTIFGQTEQTGKLQLTRVGEYNLIISYTQNGGIVEAKSAITAVNSTVNNGKLTISSNSGSYPALGRNATSGSVTITGGEVNVTATGLNGNAVMAQTVTITGGQTTLKGIETQYGINAGTVTMSLQEPEDYSFNDGFIEVSRYNGAVTINGILYDEYTDKDFSGAIANNDDLKNTKLIVGRTVAVIGDQRFHTLQAAINAISNDGMPRTIQLVNDINGENTIAKQKQIVIAESNKKITIDLNGHKILADEDEIFKVKGNNVDLTFTGTGEIICKDDDNSVAMLGENGHLTINGGVTITEGTVFVSGKNNVVDINGKINVTGEQAAIQTNGNDTNMGNVINVNDPAEVTSATDNAIYAAGDANYNINGGSVTGATAIYVKSGKLTVTDGTITGATGDGIVIDNANYPNGSPKVSIKGGIISSTADGKAPVASYSPDNTPRITGFISAGTYNKNNVEADLLAQGYVMQPDGNGMYTPVPGAGVAKIGDVYYATLDAAIAAVPTTGVETKIELLTNINATKRTVIPSNTNIVLDLGGYTLRCDNDFTISDFEGNAGEETSVTSNAKLTIQNGTVTSKEKYAIRLGGNGNTVEIAEDAVIKAGANTDYAVVLRGENNTFEINGTVEVAHGTAVSTNGLDATNNNSIIINEPAKISSPNDDAIYMPSGALTINGGTITGATGIYFKGKTLTIPASSTAVITGTGEKRAANYNGNGGDWTGDALVVDNANYPSGDPVPSIQGGTFVSANAMPIATYATGSGATLVTKFVSGGKFSEQIPVAVIAEGFICPSKPNVDSYYMLIEGSYEAEVDGMGYETFDKAVTAAGGEKVITLLNNVAEPYTMQEGQTLKVAKNGMTITMQAPANCQITETTDNDGVTTYTVQKNINVILTATDLESYFTGAEQSVPLVITDGDYTLVAGTAYQFVEGDNTTNEYKKTNVGKYTFKVKGIGKYFGEKEINWTILKSLNYETITITINPAIYNGSQKDPKDFITVKDGNTTLVAGTDYKIVTKGGPFIDAKAYIDAVSIIGMKGADKFIGDTIVTDFIINPMDVKDYSVSVSVLYRSEGYTVDKANNKDEVKNATSYALTFKDMSGNTVDVSNYDVTIADGFYRDVQRYDYTVIVTPIGDNTNVTGRLVGPLYINPGDAIDISQCLVTSKAVYNSFSQEPSYSTIEVVYKNGSNKVVLTENDFTVDYHGMMSGYVDAQTYSNAMTLKGKGNFYGSLDADYVIEPRDLADTNYNDDLVEVKAEPGKALQWTGSDLTNSIAIGDMPGGNTDAQNNIYLYMKVKDNGYRYALKAADYSYTVEPSPMVDPGEYKVLFTGRGNFTGMREVKVNVLKDINLITDGINVGLQVIPNNNRLYVKDLKNIEVKDGDQTLVEGVHYTLEVKGARSATAPYTYGENFSDPNAAAPEVYNPYIQYKGLLYAFFKGKEPYYNETVVKEFPVLYEYYAYDDENTCYNKKANGDYQSSGWDINDNANRFSFRVKPGKVTRDGNTWKFEGGEATVTAIDGIKNGTYSKTALDPAKEICAIDSKVNIAVGNQSAGTYKKLVFNLVGVEDNAFRDLPKLHCLDLTAIKGYAPENLSRTSSAPFNYIAKQALVYLNSNAVNGENYVYKVADNDYRCEELKIYEDVQGDQLGFTGEDYKWTFKNMYEFLAQKVTNTRVLTAGKHYTTCLPYSIPQVDFKAYTLDASSSNLLGFKEVAGSLEALTPYVVIPEETGKLFSATEVTIPVTGTITDNQFAPFSDEKMAKFGNTVTPTVGGHQLLGTLRYMDKNEAAGMYIMQADKKWKKVGDATSTYNGPCILPMRAYIGEPAAVTPSGSRTIGAEFTNIDGTVISLDDVKFNEDDNVYDLQGRRVETPRKGNVYIINGKKQQWR